MMYDTRRNNKLIIIIAIVLIALFALGLTCGDDRDVIVNSNDDMPFDDDADFDDDTFTDDDSGYAELEKCVIDGVPYRNLQKNPDNPCYICDVKKSVSEWTEYNAKPCDDGLFCNGRDLCYGGVCDLHEGDPCAPRQCDEEADACVDSR